MARQKKNGKTQELKKQLYITIFQADTLPGKIFDVLLLIFILLSFINIMLMSVEEIYTQYGSLLRGINWSFTLIFTIEYLLRIYCVPERLKYVFSFFGIVDFLAIFPGYLSLVITQARVLMAIRVIRLLRVFIVFNMGSFIGQANYLLRALKSGFTKISVFLFTTLTIVVIMGASMYVVEGPENGFSNIPKSIYWAIVTLTTVGYGDIAPRTVLGQTIAAIVMLSGYGIIAVPTGIMSAEMISAKRMRKNCPGCGKKSHDDGAMFCARCGSLLPPRAEKT